METWSIYLALSSTGYENFLKYMKTYWPCPQLTGSYLDIFGKVNKNRCAIVCPPDLIESFSVEGIYQSYYHWDIESELDINKLYRGRESKDISEGIICLNEEEFISDCLHQLADELPSRGVFTVQVVLFPGNEDLSNISYNILSAMKRLELWNNALLHVVTDTPKNHSCNDIKKFANFKDFNFTDLQTFQNQSYIWNGEINLMLHKRAGKFVLNHMTLHLPNQNDVVMETLKEVPLINHLLESVGNDDNDFHNIGDNYKVDKEIQVGLLLQNEDVPFHLIHPIKFNLCYHPKWNQVQFDIFKFAAAHHKDCWFLAFLCYDISSSNKTSKKTSRDWNTFLQADFTSQLSYNISNKVYKYHYPMLLKYSSTMSDSLDVYFFRDYRSIDSNALIELMQQAETLHVHDTSKEGDKVKLDKEMFISNGAGKFDVEEWYEKSTWVMHENISKVFKSISRYDSNDFYLNGVLKPGGSSTHRSEGDQRAHEGSHDTFTAILHSFDHLGQALSKSLQPVPVIPDRLLRNVKTEDDVKDLSYSNALQLIGHGIEYCVDSMSSMRLDSRLLKVQKRFVPEDTINLSKSAPKISVVTPKSDNPGNKDNAELTSKNTARKSSDSETRSERNKRRLKQTVDYIVSKHGGISVNHINYKSCCDRLYKLCLPLVRKLTSSKGLGEQMKSIAKQHLNEVVRNSN